MDNVGKTTSVEALILHLHGQMDLAKSLLQKLEGIEKDIKGLLKLKSRVKAEIKFLEKLNKVPSKLKKSHIESSNLTNLNFFIDVLFENITTVVAVLQVFYLDEDRCARKSITVDIVSNEGCTWTKVIARNTSGLLEMYYERKSPATKSILNQMRHYKTAADFNKVNYRPPQIIFNFLMVPQLLGNFVFKHGIAVVSNKWMDIQPVKYSDSSSDESDSDLCSTESLLNLEVLPLPPKNVKQFKTVNLDVTTLLCIVSNLANGHNKFEYTVPILTEQAVKERSSPALPALKEFIEGKELCVCKTALCAFKAILETVGGPREIKRAETLFKKLKVVPDSPSEKSMRLLTSAKISERSKIIFGTGDSMEAITTSANTGFIRAAEQYGLRFSVYIHNSIALTEQKERLAKPID